MLDLVLFRLTTLMDKASKTHLVDNLNKLKSQSNEQVRWGMCRGLSGGVLPIARC